MVRRGWCVPGRLTKPFALAGPPHTDGVERTSRANNIPGKSELLQIGEIGTFAPEGLEGRF